MKRKWFGMSLILFAALSSCADADDTKAWRKYWTQPDRLEFIVAGLTNCMRTATIAVMQRQSNKGPCTEDAFMSTAFAGALGLETWRCIEILKGDVSGTGKGTCGLYPTARRARKLPPVSYREDGKPGYFENDDHRFGHFKLLAAEGKWGKWRYYPPYDPFGPNLYNPVFLLFLTPEHRLDLDRVNTDRLCDVAPTVGKNIREMTAEDTMHALKVETSFSNRVFRLNEGAAFEIDASVLKPGEYADVEEGWTNSPGRVNPLLRLTSEEVSEIVFLAYSLGGDTHGYSAASARCPMILKSVSTIKTPIGKALLEALRKGGWFTK